MYDEDTLYYKYAYAGCSGFQWGWAVNAARSILNLDAVPNPALMTISVPG
jgi:hypothetical protein